MESSPISIAVLEIVGACNLRCKHCYGPFEQGVDVDLVAWKSIIQQLDHLSCREITISGGEPLLNPEATSELANFASKRAESLVLTTNGLLITSIDKDVFSPFDLIQISLEGIGQANDNIRGRGSFEKALAGIKFLKDAFPMKSIRVMMTVSEINVCEISKVHELTKDLGISFGLERICEVGNAEKGFKLTKATFRMALKYALENGIHLNDPLTALLTLDENSLHPCSAGAGALVVGYNFECFPCTKLRVPVGNAKTEPLTEIMNRIYDDYSLGDPRALKANCRNCEYTYKCGGCRAAALSFCGDMYSEDPLCWKKLSPVF